MATIIKITTRANAIAEYITTVGHRSTGGGGGFFLPHPIVVNRFEFVF